MLYSNEQQDFERTLMGCVFYFFITVVFFSVSEVALLLYVAQNTSLVFAMACCVLTGIIGGYLVKQQGLATLARIRQTLENGALPADEAIEAVMLLIVGVLLCVPGFITDFLGFLIIIPAIRKLLARQLVNHCKERIASGDIRVGGSFAGFSDFSSSDADMQNQAGKDSEIETATIIDCTPTYKEQDKNERTEHD